MYQVAMRLRLLVCVGCRPLAPPPMIAMHTDTSAAPNGTTTMTLIAGFAGTVLGGAGWGLALRGEHQVSTRTTLGLEITGGWGSEVDRSVDHQLYALRGYGRWTPRANNRIAGTYGGGLAVLDTGLVTGHAHGGVAFSRVDDTLSPVVQLGLAGAHVLRDGEPFGDVARPLPNAPAKRVPPHERAVPKSDVFFCLDVGLIGKLDGGSNRISIDVGVAGALIAKQQVLGLSIADAQQFGGD